MVISYLLLFKAIFMGPIYIPQGRSKHIIGGGSTKMKIFQKSSIKERSFCVSRDSNNSGYYRHNDDNEDSKVLSSPIPHPNTKTPLLLQNKIGCLLLDMKIVTANTDILEIINKLENFSKLIRSELKIDLKIIIESIKKRIKISTSRLKRDWNTLNDEMVQAICDSKNGNSEIPHVQHVLYKLIEIFGTIKYQIDSMIDKKASPFPADDIFILFKKLFMERFSINESFEYFKNLQSIIVFLLKLSRN